MTPDELVALYQSADSVPPSPALLGLDRVDWSAVHDAYGPATQVPALLRALLSEDADHRYFACLLLYQTIWHQGNVFSATAAAIPFLYKLLEGDGPYDTKDIAGLLGLIADGRPPFLNCEDDSKAAAEWRDILSKGGKSLDAEIAKARVVAEDVRRQLERRPDLLAYCVKPASGDEVDARE